MDHLTSYVAVALAIHALSLVIVNITPTPKDDQALDNISRLAVKTYRLIEVIAGLWGPLAKR
jgi:hypothetical protein